jgi:hypothetical protein
LHIGSQNGHLDIVRLVVDAGIGINIWNVTQMIPLGLVLSEVTGGHMLSLSSKMRKSLFIFVSKAEIDAMVEQVPGDWGDTQLSPSTIK